MKFCYSCRMYVPSDAMFCHRCGRTFNMKYCVPKLHPNALDARYCIQCGSTEMTQHDERPRPAKLRFWITAAALAAASGGFVLVSIARVGSLPPIEILAVFTCGAVVLAVRPRRRTPPGYKKPSHGKPSA